MRLSFQFTYEWKSTGDSNGEDGVYDAWAVSCFLEESFNYHTDVLLRSGSLVCEICVYSA